MALKPFGGKTGSCLQRSRFFKQVSGVWHDFQFRFGIEAGERFLVELQNLRVVFPYDEKHRRYNLR